MSFALFAISFVGVLLATSRSLGWGLISVLAVGYAYGVVRANYLGIFTTFMFDGAVLALYLKFFLGEDRRGVSSRLGRAGSFLAFLIAWPTLLSLLPINNLMIQLVALRGTVWFLPFVIVATRLKAADLDTLARGLAVLNLAAMAVGVYIYLYGVDALFPKNSYTLIIYKSSDVSGNKFHRIPSMFMHAHAYGGTMFLSLPLLLDRLAGLGVRIVDRCIAAAGVVAAVAGMLMCGARSPLMMFAISLAITLVVSRFSWKIVMISGVLIGGGLLAAATNDRLGRINSMSDTESVIGRVTISANASFLELLMTYPGGAGMGTSVGTSYPYFLADVAPEQIGMENEYCRILIDQGWVGLAAWLTFIVWLYVRMPSFRPPTPWRLGVVLMYSLTMACWLTAFLGNGTLSSVPGSAMLLIQMGILVGIRGDGRIPGMDPPLVMIMPRPTPFELFGAKSTRTFEGRGPGIALES